MSEAITLSESKRLIALEKTIEAGKQTFVAVGTALAEIRDHKLYRSDHKTFEQYCHSKWGWNRAYAGKLIEAASVVESVPGTVSNWIQNEGQARELAKVEPAKREEVLTAAKSVADAEERPMTARDISEAAPAIDEQWVAAAGSPAAWGPGGVPVKPTDHKPEDDESNAVFGLKRYWRQATKKERQQFMQWANLKTTSKKGKSK